MAKRPCAYVPHRHQKRAWGLVTRTADVRPPLPRYHLSPHPPAQEASFFSSFGVDILLNVFFRRFLGFNTLTCIKFCASCKTPLILIIIQGLDMSLEHILLLEPLSWSHAVRSEYLQL